MTAMKHTPTYEELSLWAKPDEDKKQPSTPRVKVPYPKHQPMHSPPVTDDEDFSQMIVHSADVYYIREELHRLSKDKADKETISAMAKSLETQMGTISNQVGKASHCTRAGEFAELKDAVNTWRTFFRNTIAVGSIGALFVVGGWLWQFYSLSAKVNETADSISSANNNVVSMQNDYQNFKQISFETGTKTTLEFNTKLVELEYKLLSAMSQLSKGQPIAAPAPPPGE